MAKYKLEFTNRSTKALETLRKGDKRAHDAIKKAIDALPDNPRPSGCKALSGYKDVYRIRVTMHYRVFYRIQDKELKILVVALSSKEDSDTEIKKALG